MSSSTATPESNAVQEPFPIFKLAHHYLLYDVDTVTHVRRKYNIPGHPVGTLPQASQQNIFLGLPIELMPEEARLLVTKGVAFLVDDAAEHQRSFLSDAKAGALSPEERRAFQASLRKQGQAAANEAAKQSAEKTRIALQKKGIAAGAATENWNDLPEDMYTPGPRRPKSKKRAARETPGERGPDHGTGADAERTLGAVGGNEDEDVNLFASPSNSFPTSSIRSPNPTQEPSDRLDLDDHHSRLREDSSSNPASTGTSNSRLERQPDPYYVTPTASNPPLHTSSTSLNQSPSSDPIPYVPPAKYALYSHMHSRGYFLLPGLRFGCHYNAYPGDTLRYHAHFLCDGLDWDEEFDLQEIVGGGRLATGVKKGLVLGGLEVVEGDGEGKASERGLARMKMQRSGLEDRMRGEGEQGTAVDDGVRAFTIEWSGM